MMEGDDRSEGGQGTVELRLQEGGSERNPVNRPGGFEQGSEQPHRVSLELSEREIASMRPGRRRTSRTRPKAGQGGSAATRAALAMMVAAAVVTPTSSGEPTFYDA